MGLLIPAPASLGVRRRVAAHGVLRRARRSGAAAGLSMSVGLGLAGCSGAGTDAGTVITHRSGARVTTLSASPFETARHWTLAAEPRLRIGVAAGEAPYELDGVVASRRLDDGTIVIANSGSGEVRAYDRAGAFVRSMGGLGGGPGEFQTIGWLQAIRPDTVVAIDPEFHRITAFSIDGDLRVRRRGRAPRADPLAGR